MNNENVMAMKDKNQHSPKQSQAEETENKTEIRPTHNTAPEARPSNVSSGQMSGGAMPPIQGGNQSREAEQSDLRE